MSARNLTPRKRNPRAESPLKSLAKINIAEPAEPFPTHFAETGNYMTKNRKSVIGRFRWFRWNAFLQNVWEKVPQVPLRPPAMAGKGGAA